MISCMNESKLIVIGILIGVIIVFPNQDSFGHGLSGETFSAMKFDGIQTSFNL